MKQSNLATPGTTNLKPIQRGEIVALAKLDSIETGKTLTIQVIRAGEFTDMHGTEFVLTAQDIDAYLANSNALIAQEQVPVELGHPDDSGAPAAAWYRQFFKKMVDGVEWICAEIELTALGAQSLGDQLYKYFSANLWIDEKVICGGGFVNRPAVSGQKEVGSLSQYLQPKIIKGGARVSSNKKSVAQVIKDLFKNALVQLEMSHEDRNAKIRCALKEKYTDAMGSESEMYPYPIATYDDRVIVCKDDKYFAVPYMFNADNECELGEPVEVEINWTPKTENALPAQMASQNQIQPAAVAPSLDPASVALAQSNSKQGGQPMPDQNATPTAPVIPTTNPLPVSEIDPTLSVQEQLTLARAQAREAAIQQQREFEAQLAQARKDEWERAQTEMARKQRVAALSQKLTSGNRQLPYTVNELDAILLKLSDADREIIAPVFEKIHEVGLVEMGERGSAGAGRGHKQLAQFAQPLLRDWIGKGGTVTEFFKANPELGVAEQYDLYDFEKK